MDSCPNYCSRTSCQLEICSWPSGMNLNNTEQHSLPHHTEKNKRSEEVLLWANRIWSNRNHPLTQYPTHPLKQGYSNLWEYYYLKVIGQLGRDQGQLLVLSQHSLWLNRSWWHSWWTCSRAKWQEISSPQNPPQPDCWPKGSNNPYQNMEQSRTSSQTAVGVSRAQQESRRGQWAGKCILIS